MFSAEIISLRPPGYRSHDRPRSCSSELSAVPGSTGGHPTARHPAPAGQIASGRRIPVS